MRHRVFVCYVAVMVLVFLLPVPTTPLAESKHVDKVVHFGIFLGFALLFYVDRHWKVWWTFLISVAFAGAIELVQWKLPYREGDWWDFVAGAAGAGLGVVLMLLIERQMARMAVRPAQSGEEARQPRNLAAHFERGRNLSKTSRRKVMRRMRASLLAILVLSMAAVVVTWLSTPRANGLISFTFDDGYLSGYNVAPILEKAGYRGTYYVISKTLHQNFPGYMKAAEVKSLKLRGHEVGAHTRNHIDLTTVSAIQAEAEIVGSRDDLRAIGVETKSFSYPFGRYYGQVRPLVERAGFGNAVSSDRGLNDSTTDRFVLRRMPVDRVTSFDQVKSWIDTAVSRNEWLILEHHEFDNSNSPLSVSTSYFQEVVNYVKHEHVPVVTVSQGLHLFAASCTVRTHPCSRSSGFVPASEPRLAGVAIARSPDRLDAFLGGTLRTVLSLAGCQ